MVVNPTFQQMEESTLDLIVVGTRDALTMIEAGGDQVPEQTLLEAFELAHGEINGSATRSTSWAARSGSRSGSTSS